MRCLDKRLASLEARQPVHRKAVHRIIQQVGQTEQQAIHAYGRNLIDEDDWIVLRPIIEPEDEAQGGGSK